MLVFQSVSKSYDKRAAMQNVSFELRRGEILCLLGPSGCGKTTSLMVGVGLLAQDSGDILIHNRQVAARDVFLPPEKRRVGLVFQDYALFPHMTALQNVAFGIKMGKAEREARAAAELRRLAVEDKASLYPHELSGGEQQRVALARALAPEPDILFMDEPFSSLDKHLRMRLREETRALLVKRRTACLFVTHDPEEAMRMGDRILLMRHGKILQEGAPHELYDKPIDPEAASFFGEINLLPATIYEKEGAPYARCGALEVAAPNCSSGQKVQLLIRPECFSLSAPHEEKSADEEILEATILSSQRIGSDSLILFELEGLEAPLKARPRGGHALRQGEKVPRFLSRAP